MYFRSSSSNAKRKLHEIWRQSDDQQRRLRTLRTLRLKRRHGEYIDFTGIPDVTDAEKRWVYGRGSDFDDPTKRKREIE